MGKGEIFEYLTTCGCCKICCLRFLKARGDEYEDIPSTLEKLGIYKFSEENGDCSVKKSRQNACVACLGFFSDDIQTELIEKLIKCDDIHEYDCDKIVIALSLPILLHIRQISLWIALIKKFGNEISEEKPPDVPLKEAAKLVINKSVCRHLMKTYDQNGISVNITMNHKDEDSELEKFLKFDEIVFKKQKKSKRKGRTEITRTYLEKNYIPCKFPSELFALHFPVPPAISDTILRLEKISLTGPTVFLSGRYRKLSRELSHSPWILQGKRIMENSVQELIIHSVACHFGVPEDKIIFSSSGREDVDVRCLGEGRPFVLEIPDSKRTIISKILAAEIELEIERSLKISVQNLQLVKRDELNYLKTGEEKKRKFYRALCILKEPATREILEKLDIPSGFVIQQITPLRVLHRRPLHTRSRTVYSVKGYVDKEKRNLIVLDIVTQAGTYIKELIHGEFGRTVPSISSIIQKWIDIIALDVTGIDLDWPPNIDNRKFLEEANTEVKS